MKRKMNTMTAIVQMAQKQYPVQLKAAVDHIGIDPPYGKEKIDPRTRDARLVRMLPEDLQALAQSDPKAYADASDRLAVLRQRAAQETASPAPDAYEVKP